MAFENQTVRAAKAATSEIPVLFLHAMDPVAAGLVHSLAHPGGYLTGFVNFPHSFAKQLELFKALVPSLRRVLVLLDPNDPMPMLLFQANEVIRGPATTQEIMPRWALP